jgi:Peptidase family M23
VSTPAADDSSAFPLAGVSGPVPRVPGPQRAETNGAGTRGPTRPVAVGKLNPLLALLGLLGFVAADLVGLLPVAFAALPLGLLLVLGPIRWWRARRGQLEFVLLRYPLRRELRPYLMQAGNYWLFWGLFGAIAIATPTFTLLTGPVGLRLSPGEHRLVTVLLVVAAAVMAVLALVPYRRVYLATNLLVAIGWGFLAVQLVGINRAPSDPVVIDLPLAGEWYVIHGGRSDLINAHYPSSLPLIGPEQADALDVIQVQNGRSFSGDSKQLTSYLAFGQPVLAPGDGIITDLTDTLPDLPIGTSDNTHLEGNYLVLDLGGQRYVMLAHLKQGSARVAVGDKVKRGQPIAQVGNSGDTSEPHLHLQIQNKPTFGPSAQQGLRTYPLLLRDVVLVRGGQHSTPVQADPRRDDRMRRVGG